MRSPDVSCRLYIIHKCKKLKQLDFRKVKQKEREEATQVFASAQQPEDASAQEKATTFEPDEELAQAEAAAAAAQQQVGPCVASTLPGFTGNLNALWHQQLWHIEKAGNTVYSADSRCVVCLGSHCQQWLPRRPCLSDQGLPKTATVVSACL